jgi:hypothetical protein
MRTGLLVALLFLCFSGVRAEGLNLDPWTREDSYRQSAIIVAQVIIWRQTRYIAKHPEKFYETDHVLPEHPSTGQVDAWNAFIIPAHFLVARILPKEYRAPFQYFSLGWAVRDIYGNQRIGVQLDVPW